MAKGNLKKIGAASILAAISSPLGFLLIDMHSTIAESHEAIAVNKENLRTVERHNDIVRRELGIIKSDIKQLLKRTQFK